MEALDLESCKPNELVDFAGRRCTLGEAACEVKETPVGKRTRIAVWRDTTLVPLRVTHLLLLARRRDFKVYIAKSKRSEVSSQLAEGGAQAVEALDLESCKPNELVDFAGRRCTLGEAVCEVKETPVGKRTRIAVWRDTTLAPLRVTHLLLMARRRDFKVYIAKLKRSEVSSQLAEGGAQAADAFQRSSTKRPKGRAGPVGQ